MLAGVVGAAPVECEMPVPADAEPPVGDEAAVAEDFAISECWITPPGDDVAPPTIDLPIDGLLPEDGSDWSFPLTGGPDPIPEWLEESDQSSEEGAVTALPEGWSLTLVNPWDTAGCWILPPGDEGAPPTIDLPIGEIVPEDGSISDGSTDWVWESVDEEEHESDYVRPDGWVRCATDLISQNIRTKILNDYRDFVSQNPAWPEEHGAGGIQLMVLTPSSFVPGVVLSTPGEALSFDAWLQEIRGFPIHPVFGASPNATSTVGDPTPSATAGGLSYRDAAWASLFSTSSAVESTNATPSGGRRRGR